MIPLPATRQIGRAERDAARFTARTLWPGETLDFTLRSGERRSSPDADLDGLQGLVEEGRAVSKQVQALLEGCERIVQDPALQRDLSVLRNVLHVRARIDGVLQQVTDALRVMERLTGEQPEPQTVESSWERHMLP